MGATALALGIFLAALVVTFVLGWPVAWAMVFGVLIFSLLGLHLGFCPRALWRMAWEKGRQSLLVLRILFLIGAITGLWRSSGTIAYCIYHGVRLITPGLFLFIAFLLTAALSYALGTSFGVASTAGVIFMALARSGGVNEALAAGAILSGVYFGDRCSPVSSSANLVAVVTGTTLYRNVRRMFLTALPATALTALLYLWLSLKNPLTGMDFTVTQALQQNFSLTWPALLPAAAILLLPLCRVPIVWALTASAALSALVGLTVQGAPLWQLAEAAVLGYRPEDAALATAMAGGGMLDMVSTCAVVLCTGFYAGILDGIGVLSPLEARLDRAAARLGRLPVMLGTSLAVAALFCNQSVAVLLSHQLLHKSYPDREELAMDIENTGIVLSAVVPWSIAASVPLAMLGSGAEALPYALLLWLIPLCYLPTKGWFYPNDRKENVS